MDLANEPDDRRRKRIIQVISLVFAGSLLFLTFFSNTLQSLALPKVRTERLANGSLLYTLEGNGTLQPSIEARLSNPAGWKVQQIFVKEGDLVKKGQKLIAYDGKTAERELENEITNLKKMNIELQNLQDQFIQLATGGDELNIRSAGRAIETLKLDIGTQERKINELRDRLTHGQELTAPFDGVITALNAVQGLASSGEPDVLITNNNIGYLLDIPADSALLSLLELAIGTKIDIEVHTVQEQQTRVIEGTVAELADAEPRTESLSEGEAGQPLSIPRKMVRIKVVDPELKGGEQAWIKIGKRSRREGMIISNEAVHRDREGLFVYKIDEQRGALGNVFVARKVRIQSIESNDTETMIQADSLYEDDLIILESSEPLQDGNRVRLQ